MFDLRVKQICIKEKRKGGGESKRDNENDECVVDECIEATVKNGDL